MTPYGLFSFCQNCQNRAAGSVKKFEESKHFEFYCSLRRYFMNELKIDSDRKIKKFIEVCAKELGQTFDPFNLGSVEYKEIFKNWLKKNADKGAYFVNINESFRRIYKFCVDRNIKSINEYTNKWAVSHIVSGILDENIAYMFGVHKLELSRPEKLFINKKFLNHVKLIEERIQREVKLKTILSEGVEDINKKLIWRNESI